MVVVVSHISLNDRVDQPKVICASGEPIQLLFLLPNSKLSYYYIVNAGKL